jgi:hypothetical protein
MLHALWLPEITIRQGQVVSQFGTQAIPQGPNGANSPVVKVNSFLAMAN